MNTDELIRQLGAHVEPIDRHLLARRLTVALGVGLVAALLLLNTLLGFRSDIASVAQTPLFWAKVAFPLVLAIGALWAFSRLARPGMHAGNARWLLVAPVLVVWLGALVVLLDTASDARLELVLGHTWKTCPFNIMLLAVPAFLCNLWVMRGMRPTRLRLAGALAGLLAAATATVVYCLHCPEMAVPFWGVWYLLGMLMPAALGALIGPRVLKW
ncbi:DUF1109 domain-containing protein [Stutzerimonas azotifigens]|uniref:DUF1109 domain-containing protein n=1 Tax=Stutzerimonas azotifigens TaxID=291995 RepID=A0ABR5Z3P0_9GAMM|nr:DUF1109 domain-containing protein [Stutzerimonas azotifigens]MBA1274774.1 DUF1109 domain-containing protein [Stutzerimonas azotifigens]